MNARTEQLKKLVASESLTEDETAETIGAIMDGMIDSAYAASWLTALAVKGETVDEVVGAARAMRSRSLCVRHQRPIVLDVCGTGGDGQHTINISTAVAFVVAACGVAVAKHGNRASSSRCGSADVLEVLGVPLDQSPEAAAELLDAGGVAFLFAQKYHPAMRAVAPLRKMLGIRTIFNLLGPLTNPAAATHQLIGVSTNGALEIVALAAARLGITAGAVVHGADGLDEIAGDVLTTMVQFSGGDLRHSTIDPAHFSIQTPVSDLRGGDARENAAALLSILGGEQSTRADVIALNAACALLIAGCAATIDAGLEQARAVLANGAARAVLANLQAANPSVA